MTMLLGFYILLFVMFNAVVALWCQERAINRILKINMLGAVWR